MKSIQRTIMVLAAVAILALSGIAQATTTFSISNINITPSSDSSGLSWTTSYLSVPNFTLAEGQSKTFDYATFKFTDASWLDTDNLTASFTVTPPGISQSDPATVSDFTYIAAFVDFTNTVKDVHFGNGGEFKLTFLDKNTFINGCSDLEATLSLISDSQPVPEPGTMMLLGVGLLGMALYGKRRMNA